MRIQKIALLAAGLLGLAGCSHCCGESSWWSKFCGRKSQAGCAGTSVMATPLTYSSGAAGVDCGCGSPAMEEPILTAPQKLMAEPRRDQPGYAEPMPFTPKKP